MFLMPQADGERPGGAISGAGFEAAAGAETKGLLRGLDRKVSQLPASFQNASNASNIQDSWYS